ncbi:hypothetical protein HK101_006015 [Irineochytrium annulatum]|nr:hypothetical protein HK101_006015 [Irineochytrium annulatum]
MRSLTTWPGSNSHRQMAHPVSSLLPKGAESGGGAAVGRGRGVGGGAVGSRATALALLVSGDGDDLCRRGGVPPVDDAVDAIERLEADRVRVVRSVKRSSNLRAFVALTCVAGPLASDDPPTDPGDAGVAREGNRVAEAGSRVMEKRSWPSGVAGSGTEGSVGGGWSCVGEGGEGGKAFAEDAVERREKRSEMREARLGWVGAGGDQELRKFGWVAWRLLLGY